jgi:hypothetical protein
MGDPVEITLLFIHIEQLNTDVYSTDNGLTITQHLSSQEH